MNDPGKPRAHTSGPRVFVDDTPDGARPAEAAAAPLVFETRTPTAVVPRERAAALVPPLAAVAPRRRSGWVRLGLWGLGVGFVGWLGVDAYQWISNAFASSAALGWAASAVVAAGAGGAMLIAGHEIKSFLALKSVEANQRRFADDSADAGRRCATPFARCLRWCRKTARAKPPSKPFNVRRSSITRARNSWNCCRAR